jgi:syntaxin-binding protein 5
VTALKHSDVGFIAIRFEGSFAIIDIRGPAIIYTQLLGDLSLKSKKVFSWRSNSQLPGGGESPTVIEFSVMTLDDDGKPLLCYSI